MGPQAKPTVLDLTGRFRAAAIAQANWSDEPDKVALHEEMSEVVGELVGRGDRGNLALEKLVKDESVYVRLWAAAHLLVLGEGFSNARDALDLIAGAHGCASESARVVLNRFDAGTLNVLLRRAAPASGARHF
jgi:hypothetical protein